MQVQKLVYYQYSPLSATVYDYGRFLEPVPGYGAITSAGSSTTITYNTGGAIDAYNHPFQDFSVGTIMGVRLPGGLTTDLNVVTAVASDQSITIGAAKDYTVPTGAYWYQKFLKGTTVTDGWIYVGDMRTKLIKIVVSTLTSTSIGYSIEMKMYNLDTAAAQILAATITSGTVLLNTATIQIPETCAALRVGLRGVGGPNVTDKVNVFLLHNPGNAESAN